ncbi:hypothetical protein [Algoriphagus boritolerans]|uniref:hypothetical protein n=1 Tax=Algoriphagus boritolerans TaxID=308111 RepID=UPI002FCE635A
MKKTPIVVNGRGSELDLSMIDPLILPLFCCAWELAILRKNNKRIRMFFLKIGFIGLGFWAKSKIILIQPPEI